MPKLKLSKNDFDVKELDVEWSEDDFEDYDGEQPPTGTVLRGVIKKIWWTYTQADETPMLKVLWTAKGNKGDLAEYNGLPIWDNIVFSPKAAFRYGPFLQAVGITLNDVYSKTFVADEDDNVGAPVEKIGSLVPGDADVTVVTKRRKWQGEWQVNVSKYLSADEADTEDDDDEDEPTPRRKTPARPKSSPKRRTRPEPEPDDEDEDEEDPEEDDEDTEDEEEQEDTRPTKRARPSARSKPAAKRRAPAKSSRRASAASDDDEEDPF